VARFHSATDFSNVVIASGCSGALELALTALLDPGTVLLVPSPGFPLYQVIAESHGASVVHYQLLPNKNWECNVQHMEELVALYGSKVRGILVNNPSNPTGCVFSKSHLEALVSLCSRHRLPIVADEVYGDLTFEEHPFIPLADVAASLGREVPVITASGLAKQFLVPGWRVGWIVFQDKYVATSQAHCA
jgi:tyrosine aminotransferase